MKIFLIPALITKFLFISEHMLGKTKKLVELMARHQEYLTSKLKDKELDAFKKYVDYYDEYTSMVECQAFEIGFKLAIRLLTE